MRRLEDGGLLEGRWEDEQDAHERGRPQRRLYALTRAGARTLESALQKLARTRRTLCCPTPAGHRVADAPDDHAAVRWPRRIVRLAALCVPASERTEWEREWEAELVGRWHESPSERRSQMGFKLDLVRRTDETPGTEDTARVSSSVKTRRASAPG